MAVEIRCDYCGEVVEHDEPFVSLQLEDVDRKERPLGDYHTDDVPAYRGSGYRDCWSRMHEAIRLANGAGPGIASMPVADVDPDLAPGKPNSEGATLLYRRRWRASDLPEGLPDRARRALIAAGYWRMSQLAACEEAEVAAIEGVGPRALRQIRKALSERAPAAKEAN